MSQHRYKIINDLQFNYWFPQSPVEIYKGAILLDTVSDISVLQLKLCNVSSKTIASVHITIKCFDETGDLITIANDINFAYQDLKILPNVCFGEQNAILLPDKKVRNVEISFTKVMFSDGEILKDLSKSAEAFPEFELISSFGLVLVNEYNRISNKDDTYNALFVPQEFKDNDTWSCCCGRMNMDLQSHCVRCNRSKEKQFKIINKEYLQKSLKEHESILEQKKQTEILLKLELDKKQKEDEKHKQEKLKIILIEKKKWRKKIAIVAFITILVAILANVIIIMVVLPNMAYGNAEKLYKNKEYDKAIIEFAKLDNFKDSAKKILIIKYDKANELFKKGQYDNAISAFAKLGNYMDSTKKISDVKYAKANELFGKGEYDNSIEIFASLGNYKNSLDMIDECNCKLVSFYIESKDWKVAIEKLYHIPTTNKNWKDLESSIYYNRGIEAEQTNISVAKDFYTKINLNYKDVKTKLSKINQYMKYVNFWYSYGLYIDGWRKSSYGDKTTVFFIDNKVYLTFKQHTGQLVNGKMTNESYSLTFSGKQIIEKHKILDEVETKTYFIDN